MMMGRWGGGGREKNIVCVCVGMFRVRAAERQLDREREDEHKHSTTCLVSFQGSNPTEKGEIAGIKIDP